MGLFSRQEPAKAQQPDSNDLAELKRRMAALELALEEVQTKVMSAIKRYNQRLTDEANREAKPSSVTPEDLNNQWPPFPSYGSGFPNQSP